jgi:excisionase family DNA binding protein
MTRPAVNSRRYLTPGDVAEDIGVDLRQVLRWIKAGELRAVNVVGRVGKRPRWRIAATDLEQFLDRRSASPAPATPRRRRRDPQVTEFF